MPFVSHKDKEHLQSIQIQKMVNTVKNTKNSELQRFHQEKAQKHYQQKS